MKNKKSDVTFKNDSRVHFGLRVKDLEQSISFYSKLLQAGPSKVREGYAKFDLDTPSINLALNQTDQPIDTFGAVNHFGLQLQSTEALKLEIERLKAAGIDLEIEEQVTCCYAVQNKAWATDPDSNRWELFVVTDKTAQTLAPQLEGSVSKDTPSARVACC